LQLSRLIFSNDAKVFWITSQITNLKKIRDYKNKNLDKR